ncbi:MAG: serine/threonine-protein kinase, partial [Planctomycetota bacterium]
ITGSGIGYIAMEYVAGIPITHYCANRDLPTRERLELFQQVCLAVAYLHRKEVIHRDIKPSNILVEQKGDLHVPKLIDFGVAKITSPSNTSAPATRTGFMIGTPQYMCPEQAILQDGVPPDVRGDVYSLGITLYELLVGRPPIEYDPVSDSLLEILQSIRDGEIDIPSRTLKQDVALRREQQDAVQGLVRDLRSGLDAVVMKAIDVDPNRRYQTPTELSDDIQQFLDGKPVGASLPGWFQHTTKWINRHRVLTIASGVFAIVCSLLLVMAAIATSNAALERQARATIQFHIDEVALNRTVFRDSQREFEEQMMEKYHQPQSPDDDSMQGFPGMYPMMSMSDDEEMVASDPMLATSMGLRNISPWLSWDERAAILPLLTTPFSAIPALGQQHDKSASGFLGSLFGAMIRVDSIPEMDSMPAKAFEQTVEFTEILLKNQKAELNKDSMIVFDSCCILAQIYLLADMPEEALDLCNQSLSVQLHGDQSARRLLAEALRLTAQVEVEGMQRDSLKPLTRALDQRIAKLTNDKNREQLKAVFSNLKIRMRKHSRR